MKRELLVCAILTSLAVSFAFAHCEIPCGIYDDDMRLKMIEEHIATIEKSMKAITELSGEKTVNYNQIVRWVENKEKHADHIREIVSQYFMTQRIKPTDAKDAAAYEKYVKELTLLHGMLVSAMKAKQTTDPALIETLRGLLKEFGASYGGRSFSAGQ